MGMSLACSNTGDIVGNIESRVNQIQSQGAEQFKQAIKSVADNISEDEALAPAQKKEALESTQFLSESATEKPENRKLAVVKATIKALPDLLKTAQAAGETA